MRILKKMCEEGTLLCSLDRIFDDATMYKLRGKRYRGRKLETVTLEVAAPGEQNSQPSKAD